MAQPEGDKSVAQPAGNDPTTAEPKHNDPSGATPPASAWRRLARVRPRSWWSALFVWPATAAVAAIAGVRVLDLDPGVVLVQLISFTPYFALFALAAAILAGLARRLLAAATATLMAIALLACVAPRAFGGPHTAAGTPLVVMAANLRVGGADAMSIVDLVRDAGVDVLALQEFTPDAEERLAAAGLLELLPYRESHPRSGVEGSAVYARWPLRDGGVRLASPEGFEQAYATVTLPEGATITVESVHPVPPINGDALPHWETGLRDQFRGDAPGPPRILAGDFNATLDHSALRDVLDTGYRDAAAEVGAGLTPTWPFYGRRPLITPSIALDHVLVPAGIYVRDFRAVTIPRTDHRAIVATLVIPA